MELLGLPKGRRSEIATIANSEWQARARSWGSGAGMSWEHLGPMLRLQDDVLRMPCGGRMACGSLQVLLSWPFLRGWWGGSAEMRPQKGIF